MASLLSLPSGWLVASVVYAIAGIAVYLLVLRAARRRSTGWFLCGGSLLFAEGWLGMYGVGPQALIVVAFAGIGDGGVQAAMVAFIVVGIVVLGGGLGWMVTSVLAMRGSRGAARVGIVLSWLTAGFGFATRDHELLGSILLSVGLVSPAVCLILGLYAGRLSIKPSKVGS